MKKIETALTDQEKKLWNDYIATGRKHGTDIEGKILMHYFYKYKPYCYREAKRLLTNHDNSLINAALVSCQLFILKWLRTHDMSADFSVSFAFLKYKIIDFCRKEDFNYNKYAKTEEDSKERNKEFLNISNIEALVDGNSYDLRMDELDILACEDEYFKLTEIRDLFNKIINMSSNIFTERQREVFELYFIKQKDVKEICEITNLRITRVSHIKSVVIEKIKNIIINSNEFNDINSHEDLEEYFYLSV